MEQRAILSLSPENFLTIWLMAIGLYLATALFYQVFGRLSGGFNSTGFLSRTPKTNPQTQM